MWPLAPSSSSPPLPSSSAVDPFELWTGEFVLRYRPQVSVDGRHFAYVIVFRDLDGRRGLGLRTVAALMPDIPSFERMDEAAAAGREAGMRWIAERIGRESRR